MAVIYHGGPSKSYARVPNTSASSSVAKPAELFNIPPE